MLFAMAFTIPILLWLNAWQANRIGLRMNDIRELERAQETLVEENRTIAAEIANLLAVNRLESDAVNRLGMTRVNPENVTLIIVGGN